MYASRPIRYHATEEEKTNQLQQTQKVLGIQLKQAVGEISPLRKSQDLTRQYRHDLRLHLQYVSACIENGQVEQDGIGMNMQGVLPAFIEVSDSDLCVLLSNANVQFDYGLHFHTARHQCHYRQSQPVPQLAAWGGGKDANRRP